MSAHRLLFLALCASLITLAPANSFAQDDFEFDDEESSEDGGGEEGDDFDFDEDDGGDEGGDEVIMDDEGDEGPKTLAVVAIPSENIDAKQRAELQSAMMRAVQVVRKYDIQGDDNVLPALDDRGPEDCVKEPICLANVGEDAGVDLLLIGRLVPEGDSVRLTLDLFDTREKLFLATDKSRGPRDLGGALEDTQPLVKNIFEIRELEDGPLFDDNANAPIIQTVFAYSTAALAVACIGGGVYFGLDAAAQADAIKAAEKNASGRYVDQTQAQAQAAYNDAQATATSANLFYGLGFALAATSVALFVIDFGGDVASEEELNDRRRSSFDELRITPAVTPDGVGAAASFRF